MIEINARNITYIEGNKGSGMDLFATAFAYAMRQATIKICKNKYWTTSLAGKTAYVKTSA